MSVVFKPDETFRDDFRYQNSLHAIRRFPLPFPDDKYMYSVNIEPHTAGPAGSVVEHAIDIDEHYVAECKDRALVLADDPVRCQALPHMLMAQWDALELVMESLSRDYPEHFKLTKWGTEWHWENRPLDIQQRFTFGDPSTLPCPPFEYIMRQTQGDWVIMDQRDGNLYAEAGIATSAADWSLDFDIGMSFNEWHGPVPLAHDLGVFERAQKFLLKLRLGAPVRRLNWTMTIHPRLDTSPEMYYAWGSDRAKVTLDNVADLAHLRVELQALWRLPRSNAVIFSIRAYLISLRDIATVPKWARRVHRALKTLHPALVDYKGLTRYRDTAVQWLSQFDDGTPTTPGTAPE